MLEPRITDEELNAIVWRATYTSSTGGWAGHEDWKAEGGGEHALWCKAPAPQEER